MDEKKEILKPESAAEGNETQSHREARLETRRRLLKAGVMSIPVVMTVYSRPLFAQTNGSVDALAYGGYDEAAGASLDEHETSVADPFSDPWNGLGRSKTKNSEKPNSQFLDNNSRLQ